MQQQNASNESSVFDENDPKYKCCCNHFSSTKGTLIIGWIRVAESCLSLIGCLIGYSNWLTVIASLIGVFIGATSIQAVRKRSASMLLPSVIFSILTMAIEALAVFGLIVLGPELIDKFVRGDSDVRFGIRVGVTAYLVSLIVSFALNGWFLLVQLSARQYMIDKDEHEIWQANVQQMQQPAHHTYVPTQTGTFNAQQPVQYMDPQANYQRQAY